MTNYSIPVHSDQELTPRAIEVLRAVLDGMYPEHRITFTSWNGSRVQGKVLVFGRGPEGRQNSGVEFVYTYSIAQMMSKPNSASVIAAALRQFIEEPAPIPFNRPTKIPVDVVALMARDKPVAIDIETSGNLSEEDTTDTVNIISVAFYQPGFSEPRVVVGGNLDGTLTDKQIAVLAAVLPCFTRAIYHNGKFDIRVLNRVLGVKLVNWFDTMLAHHSLNIAAGDHKLKTLARRYLGAPEWEADLRKYLLKGGHYERIPVDKLVEYNGWDVYWTYKLWEFLAPQIEADEEAEKNFELEMAAADFLLDVEVYGVPMDLDYLESYGKELEHKLLLELHLMRDITAHPEFNPNSPKQVKERLHDLGLPDLGTTDVETLTMLYEESTFGTDRHTFLESLLAFRKLTKISGTYVKGWSKRQRDGRVHPTFLVHGTSTGRLSSTNPNAQNVPRDKAIRKIVRSRDGL